MCRLKTCVVSSSRAEFGQLLPLLLELEQDAYFDLDFVVTGAHLSNKGGNTLKEIEEYPVNISKTITIKNIDNDSRLGISMQISEVIASFSEYFHTNTPDLLIVIGDRYEMFAIGVAANTLLIPIVHICGGSTTSGAIDEVYRHSLTKMSLLHFTTCNEYRKRVIQLGENPDRVFNVGSLAIENCLKMNLNTESQFRNFVGIEEGRKYCVVTFHPVTLEEDSSNKEVYELIHALDEFSDYDYVITLANTDHGGNQINEIWKNEAKARKNFVVVPSLGMKRYLTALKYSEMMIGNSSSGTTEGPAMNIPTIDIGDRQKGRFFAESVIHCDAKSLDIIKAINLAKSNEFLEKVKKTKNPFGDGTTSKQIVQKLKNVTHSNLNLKKDFYDIDFEVEK